MNQFHEKNWLPVTVSVIAIATILAGVLPLAPVIAAVGTGLSWKSRWSGKVFIFALVVLIASLLFLALYIDTSFGGSTSISGSS